jgi:N-acetylmuramoyl-L-alanine amidase
MRRLITLTLAVVLAASASAAAQTTAKSLYARAQSREQAARKALDAARPADVVRKDIARTIASYEIVVAKYPRSAYSDNALWQAGMLSASSYARYRVESDRTDALRLLKRLASEYPTSSLMRQAKPALARLNGTSGSPLTNEVSSPAGAKALAPPAERSEAPPASEASGRATSASEASAPRSALGAAAQIRAIRRTMLPEVVRVAIELDREVDYHDERISGPERVFVDLHAAQAAPSVRSSESWDEDVVRGVRIGPRPGGTTRVVLDLASPGRYSVFTLYNPFRVVIDLDRVASPGAVLTANPSTGADTVLPATLGVPAAARGSALAPFPAPVAKVIVPVEEAIRPAPQVDSVAPGATLTVQPASPTTAPPAAQPSTPPQSSATPTPSVAPLQAKKSVTSQQIAKEPAEVVPAPPAENLQGRFSLSRQLGLGISRIVIDPGHGGHDPGAQTRGLNEADLVLDVALRLQQLLLKASGFEVVLTRDTDVFIPLEERTAIANRAGADLFLSIHANASRNAKAHGVETYFLNFASNPDAEAVAARENSASGQTMHNLPDIVKAITLNNKLDESRDFATLVQRAMIDKLGTSNKQIRDLGVRQAPFVVLIGAGMPSILAEISFLTHQQEGKLLKTPAYRQKIAEALFAGVQEYQRSLKAVKTAARQ